MLRAFVVIIAALPGIAAASDRTAAEWVLRAGGSVILDGHSEIWDIAQLPAGELHVRAVNLLATTLKPNDFARLRALPDLRELFVSGRTWHSLPASTAVA